MIYHATVAKGAKVNKKEAIRGGLIGLCVIFSLGTKKDPRGIAPRVYKQTDDSLKFFSYGDGGVKQASQPILIPGGKQRWALERC